MHEAEIRILHAGDICLDGQITHVLPIDPDNRLPFQDATLKAFERLIFAAVEHSVSAVLITGQLFANDGPTLRACMTLQEACLSLLESQIDVILACSDIEQLSDPDVATFLPEGIHILTPQQQRPLRLEFESGRELFIGHRLQSSTDPARWQIELLAPREHTISSAQIPHHPRWIGAQTGPQRQSMPATSASASLSAPGSIQGLALRDSGRHGANLLITNEAQQWEIEFVPLAMIQFGQFPLQVTTQTAMDGFMDQVEDLIEQTDVTLCEQVCFLWKISGHGELLEMLLEKNNQSEFLDHLAQISPTHPRYLHFLRVVPVHTNSAHTNQVHTNNSVAVEQLAEQFQSFLFHEQTGHPLSLPELPAHVQDYCTLVGEDAWHKTDEETIFDRALMLGQTWLGEVEESGS